MANKIIFSHAGAASFGSSVALSGNGLILAVGMRLYDEAAADQGAVFVYDLVGSDWVQRGEALTASDAADSDSFGSAVALSADGLILAVGAPSWEGGTGSDRGGVYVYDYSGGAWVQRGAVLAAGDAADSDSFGSSVALSADGLILAVGAPNWEGAAGSDRGGVYVYDYSGGAWVQRGSVLAAADAANSDYFGRAVALSADGLILAAGADYWEGSLSSQGGVYIFDYSGGAWVQRGAVLTTADAATNDHLGNAMALSADGLTLAVGCSYWEGGGTNQGGVYLFDYSGGAWVQRGAVLTTADAGVSDFFGGSLALSADAAVLTVGAASWEGSQPDQGAVYTFDVDSLAGTVTERGILTDGFQFSRLRTLPVDDPWQVGVVVDKSEGGELYAYDKGVAEQHFYLRFDGLTQDDFDNFDHWFRFNAVGPKNPFAFTGQDGTVAVVRLLDTKNPLKMDNKGVYSGTITLRREV